MQASNLVRLVPQADPFICSTRAGPRSWRPATRSGIDPTKGGCTTSSGSSGFLMRQFGRACSEIMDLLWHWIIRLDSDQNGTSSLALLGECHAIVSAP